MRLALLLPALVFGSVDALAQPLDAAMPSATETAPSSAPTAADTSSSAALPASTEGASAPATSGPAATPSSAPASPVASSAPDGGVSGSGVLAPSQASVLPLDASAGTGPSPAAPDSVEPGDSAGGSVTSFRLQENPGWSGSLSANGQLLAMFGTDSRGAYSAGGGTVRLRYRYYTIGANYEVSDPGKIGGEFSEVGGLVGAYLPFHNWLDFEIAARVGQRTYANGDRRFGPGGYTHATPVLGISGLVSDRSNAGLFGGRLGGGMRASYDLKQADLAWTDTSTDPEGQEIEVGSGVDHVGGLSVALFIDVGLDVSE